MKNFIIHRGWVQGIKHIHSPNYNLRPDTEDISLLVIHNISLPPKQFTGNDVCDFFCNQLDTGKVPFYQNLIGLEVSAHLFIRRDGEVIQFVSFADRAWHAGQSVYKSRKNCNDFSIGIELEGCDDIDYQPAQYDALQAITKALIKNYPKITDNITGHQHISPKRKTDPGKSFDWGRYIASI